MRIFTTFLIGLISLCDQWAFSEEAQAGSQLHVCTVAIAPDKSFSQLMKSCQQQGIQLDVLGMLKPYRGLGERFLFIQEYIQNMSDNDIVLYVDSDAGLIMANKDEILHAFHQTGVPFVIAADRDSSLDSGSYIGYVGTLKAILKEMSPLDPFDTDQHILKEHYLAHPNRYNLDSKSDLFLSLAGVTQDEIAIDAEHHRVVYNETHSKPCIINGHGSNASLYQAIVGELNAK